MSTTETALTAHLVMPTGYPAMLFCQVCKDLHDHFGIEHSTPPGKTGDLITLASPAQDSHKHFTFL